MLNPKDVIWIDKMPLGWEASLWDGNQFIREQHWQPLYAANKLVDKVDRSLKEFKIVYNDKKNQKEN